MIAPIRLSLYTLSFLIVMTGCHHDDDEDTTNTSNATMNTIQITPSLGKILNAKITLKNAKTGGILGVANTGSLGSVSFQVNTSITHVVAEVTGEATSKYFDEAKGEQSLPDNISLRVVAPIVNNANVGVSVFTEAAVRHAETLTDGLSKAENIDLANKTIAEAVGMTNITQAPALIGNDSDYQNLSNDAAGAYALKLAGLVKMSANSTSSSTPALEVLDKLAQDLSDGLIDGKNKTQQIDNTPYPQLASVLTASWQFSMQTIVNTITNATLQTQLKTEVIAKTDIKEAESNNVVTGSTDFGGSAEQPWKGEIYLLAENTGQLPDFSALTAIGTLFTNSIDIPLRSFTDPFPGVPSDRYEWFGVRYQGPLTVTEAGSYQFATNSDDGSKLYIDNQLIINNDYTHPQNFISNTIELTAGVHTFRLEYFQGPRFNIALQVYGSKAGSTLDILTPVLPKPVVVN